jgi:thymidine phosphorylase
MSKKIAGGAQHIVLDVKVGDGAFLPDVEEATSLAELCVDIGRAHGRRTAALVTDMSQPLGPAIGNALEVAQAIDVLAGRAGGRLRDVSVELTAAALTLTGTSPEGSRAAVERALADGAGLDRLARMVAAQGGDPAVCDDPWSVLERAPVRRVVTAATDGVVARVGARALGHLAGRLGAGRQRAGDAVDPAVGITLDVEVGSVVSAGDALLTVHARDEAAAEDAAARASDLVAVVARTTEVVVPDLVRARVGW